MTTKDTLTTPEINDSTTHSIGNPHPNQTRVDNDDDDDDPPP